MAEAASTRAFDPYKLIEAKRRKARTLPNEILAQNLIGPSDYERLRGFLEEYRGTWFLVKDVTNDWLCYVVYYDTLVEALYPVSQRNYWTSVGSYSERRFLLLRRAYDSELRKYRYETYNPPRPDWIR